MLVDDLLAAATRQKRYRPTAGVTLGELADIDATLSHALRTGQRFVLSPFFASTAVDLARPKSIERSRDYLHTPAYVTWLEWAGAETPGCYTLSNRHGFLLVRHEQTRSGLTLGWGCYAFDLILGGQRTTVMLPLTYDIAGDGPILTWLAGGPVELASVFAGQGVDVLHAILGIDLERLAAFLGASLALINTPRVVDLYDHEMGRLNRQRRQLNRPPILSYREVRINPDRAGARRQDEKTGPGGIALHHVRAFLRLQRGKVVLVTPHWRGNPRFGMIRHRYLALREEDVAGQWMGGPLPPAQVLHEMVERD